MRRIGRLFTLISLGLTQAGAQTPDEIQDLREKVARLERIVDALRNRVGELEGHSDSAALSVPEIPAAPVALPEETRRGFFSRRSPMPPELVPDIGKIGAEVGVLAGASSNPYKLNSGQFAGGYIDLPLFDQPAWLHGKVSYEILVGLSQSKTVFPTTSNVAQVANLTVLNAVYPNGGINNVVAAVSGTGPAPFPVTTSTATQLRLLQVVPFSLKYTSNRLERWRLRPYIVGGFGVYVTIHSQNPGQGNPPTYGVRTDSTLPPAVLAAVESLFGGQAPFGGPLVAGQISQSPELEQRGLPGGHGNISLGLHSAAGIDYRLTPTFSLGFDARYSRISGTYGNLATYGMRLGMHF